MYEYYTIEETEKYLKVKRGFVVKLLKGNQLKGSKLGKIWRIKKNDIDDYIEKNSNKGVK